MWVIPLKNKNSQTITEEFSNNLTTSKRSPVKLESDRGAEIYNSVFQNFLECKNIHHFSSFTDKGPSVPERVITTIRNLLKKAVFEKGNADWLSEAGYYHLLLRKIIIQVTIVNKITPAQASKKPNEKEVFSNLRDHREKQKPKFYLGQLVRIADTKFFFQMEILQTISKNFIQ